MLAALLCNPHRGGQYKTTQRATSSIWNPEWSIKYGPDAERYKEDEDKILEAIEAIKSAEYVPPELEEIKKVLHKRSLVDELNDYKPDTDYYLVYLLEAYFYFLEWRKKDDEAIAMALLMMEF